MELELAGGHRCQGTVLSSGAAATIVDRHSLRTVVRTDAVRGLQVSCAPPAADAAVAGAGFEPLVRTAAERGGSLSVWTDTGAVVSGRTAWCGVDCIAVERAAAERDGGGAWSVLRFESIVAVQWTRERGAGA